MQTAVGPFMRPSHRDSSALSIEIRSETQLQSGGLGGLTRLRFIPMTYVSTAVDKILWILPFSL